MGWGLLEYNGKTVRVAKLATRLDQYAPEDETRLLVSLLRRLPAGIDGVRVRYYTDDDKTKRPRGAVHVQTADTADPK